MAARPPFWRTAVLLTAMVLLLLIAAVAGFHALTAKPQATQTPCATQTVSGTVKAADVAVHIYNYQGGTVGLAGSLKTKLVAAGFTKDFINTDNLPPKQDVPASTTIIGGKADDPEVKLVAGFFPGSVTQADSTITDHSVSVWIGATWAGFDASFKADAPTKVSVDKATICRPIITPGASTSGSATPTATPTDTATDTPTDTPTDQPT